MLQFEVLICEFVSINGLPAGTYRAHKHLKPQGQWQIRFQHTVTLCKVTALDHELLDYSMKG